MDSDVSPGILHLEELVPLALSDSCWGHPGKGAGGTSSILGICKMLKISARGWESHADRMGGTAPYLLLFHYTLPVVPLGFCLFVCLFVFLSIEVESLLKERMKAPIGREEVSSGLLEKWHGLRFLSFLQGIAQSLCEVGVQKAAFWLAVPAKQWLVMSSSSHCPCSEASCFFFFSPFKITGRS
jgi:hypothetical protein